MQGFSVVGFQDVADTANFIVLYPEAIAYLGFTTAWNSGAGADVLGTGTPIFPNEDVDDVGFINALMDTVSSHFNIDQNKIFVTGFSMGAFMTNRLACELGNRVSAAAAVAATIPTNINCSPGLSIPMCEIHGTADATVGYGTDGGGSMDNDYGMSVNEWISHWNANNSCSGITLEGRFPDSANDGLLVDYVEYGNCDNNSRTVHYKVHGADHWWLNSGSGGDIDYTAEIWKFFLGLSPDNLTPAGLTDVDIKSITIYPNPTSNSLRLENFEAEILNISVFNTTGQLVKEISATTNTIDVSDLNQGVYQLMVATEDGLYSNSFVKE